MKIIKKLITILLVLFMTIHPLGALAASEGNNAISEEETIEIANMKMMFEDSSGAIKGKYVTFSYTNDADISDFTLDGIQIFSSISIKDFKPTKKEVDGSEAKFEMDLDSTVERTGTLDGTEEATEDATGDATEDATIESNVYVTYNLKDSNDNTPDGTEDATADDTHDGTEDATPDGTPGAAGTMGAVAISDDDVEKIKFELHDNANGLIKIDVKGTRTVTFELAEGIEQEGDGTIVLTGENFYGSIVQVGHEGGSVSFKVNGNTITAQVTDARLMFRSQPVTTVREEADHEVKVMQGIVDGDVGAEVFIEDLESTNTVVYDGVTISIDEIKDDLVQINVNSEMTGGTTISLWISSDILKSIQNEKVTILYDGEPIELADNYDDIMSPDDDNGEAEFLAVVGAQGAEILVSIPHFSPHSITITTGEPAGQPGFEVGLAVIGLFFVFLLFKRRD